MSQLLLAGEAGKKKKKRRHRPFAAARERERLLVMNSALKKLKLSLPLKDSDQKISKKEILQTAVLYIRFLMSVLQESDSEKNQSFMNLREHNYLKRKSPWIFTSNCRS